MDRCLAVIEIVVHTILSLLSCLIIMAVGTAAGALLSTMVSIVFGSPQARGLTLYSPAAWCPLLEPRALHIEQIFWLICVICGWTASQLLIAWLFLPDEIWSEVRKK